MRRIPAQVFADTRAVAEDRTFRFLAAALADAHPPPQA